MINMGNNTEISYIFFLTAKFTSNKELTVDLYIYKIFNLSLNGRDYHSAPHRWKFVSISTVKVYVFIR
ncbi:hypothetical protein MTBBW1_2010006 [Desulfamplus magnetovallimortis]|uniref:Uncharacterized protein n=1 Tax=Desulfamplus magnetovallimortis TaxID=1246637 RepID=A0A1W1HBM9_9BACT|nr:hypothetical protein MTBBW1_2010006 [Desulfamplus magnetovallimortis]